VDYSELVSIRNNSVEEISSWLWVTEDNGAFDGPKSDWGPLKQGILDHVKNFDVVVQAGGNCGMYPRLLSDMFKRVYTFEPDPLNFHCLSYNCQKDNIYKMNAALGETNKLVRMQRVSMTNVGGHRVSDTGDTFIPTFTIDQLALDKCDYISLDCEGYEPNVIAGAMETISKFLPVITLETVNEEINTLLSPLGYKKIDGHFGHADKLFAVK
jgi:FkbM family methyltransferase